jgi:tetratricopeptide (TPR) repeat protein
MRLLLILLSLFVLAPHVVAADLNWTKVQDLNPNAAPTNTPVKQKWAVVIGVGKYKESRLNSDTRPDEAAENFQKYLLDPHGGRFDPSHVKLLINDAATRQNIMDTLGPAFIGKTAGPDDLVVVYIATNSFPTTDGSAYLTTYNCALDNVYSTCISIQSLMQTLKQNSKAKRVVLVMQASYSGAAELAGGAKDLTKPLNFDAKQVDLGQGYVLISSSAPDQMSWGNLFTDNLISALRQKDGQISLPQAFDEARTLTQRDTTGKPNMRPQTPVMKYDWKGQDIVIGILPSEKPATLPPGVESRLGAESHYLKANQLVEQSKLDEAAKEFETTLQIDPHYADAIADYGSVFALKSDWRNAAEKYKTAIAERSDDALFHANYARALAKLGKDSDCLSELETAHRLDPKDRNVAAALSDRYIRADQNDKAAELLKAAVEIHKADAALRTRLSTALANKGDLDSALSEAREAVRLDPSNPSYKLNLGSMLLLSSNADEAIKLYQEVIAAQPTNPDAHLLLARLLDSAGDRPGARNELSKYLECASPGDPRVHSAKERLAELAE